MTTSIHGWPVIEAASDRRLKLFKVPGVPARSLRLRKDVGPYLVAFAAQYHRTIAPLDVATFDDWSWSPLRTGRASSKISDHCAGVAVDLNATREGAQSVSNLTWWANPVRRTKLAWLRRRFKFLEWGGDYSSFRDPMHWTFRYGVTTAMILAEMKRMGVQPDGTIKQTLT